MAASVLQLTRESEIAALRLQEQELQEQQDALLAQRLALAYACRDVDADDDVEFVMEVTAEDGGSEETNMLEAVRTQLLEIRHKQGQLEAVNLIETQREQERASATSRRVADVLAEQDRWNAKVAEHDAAFARYINSVDSVKWANHGDEIADPLDLPPPRQLLEVDDDAPAAAGDVRKGPKRPAECPPATDHTTRRLTRARTCQEPPPTTTSRPLSTTTPRCNTMQLSDGNLADSNRRVTKSAAKAAASAAATGLGSAPSGSASAGPSLPTIECLCCYDRFPEDQVMCAGSEAASSSTSSAGCGHYFCFPCLTEYVRGAVRDRKYPVACPMAAGADGKGCKLKLSREHVLAVLEKHPADQQTFSSLEAQEAIAANLRIYCPHKSCSALMMGPENDDDLPPDAPISCPACYRAFCPRCLIPGWHHGYTCSQFQALPAHLRSAEDAAMLAFSARQQWKQCPKCGLMVERSEGCNHMLCRCGANFCYGCGKRYKNKKPTADNAHGTPACGCPLFDIPEDADDNGGRGAGGQGAGAGAGGGAPARHEAVRPVPWRGGRMVARRHCRHSASIHDCPYGRRCWYWHEVEDGPL